MLIDYIEPNPVPEIYTDGVADVEVVGGECVVFTFYRIVRGERVANLRIIRPIDSLLQVQEIMELVTRMQRERLVKHPLRSEHTH